jgi:hypothetical protein
MAWSLAAKRNSATLGLYEPQTNTNTHDHNSTTQHKSWPESSAINAKDLASRVLPVFHRLEKTSAGF